MTYKTLSKKLHYLTIFSESSIFLYTVLCDAHTFFLSIRKLKIRTYNLNNLVLKRLNPRFFCFVLFYLKSSSLAHILPEI